MTNPFVYRAGLIVVRATILGPAERVELLLALDTGAAWTTVRPDALAFAGYTSSGPAGRLRIATANGHSLVPWIRVNLVQALGRERRNVAVLAHNLPPGVPVDGLLGLDFLRARRLLIDFETRTIELT